MSLTTPSRRRGPCEPGPDRPRRPTRRREPRRRRRRHPRPGGARKDTGVILPRGRLTLDFDADNPGLWTMHCHDVHHSESGMTTVLDYRP
ncbi:multicopper oxidase domain-containing protein [Streptomyces sp. NPDC058613]|uniref:multicopper oxidase domain-containing protein n=1 Tax=Streptomyces sp. NPDC058613 TaxID=3346556 RepID=UPI00365413EE